MPSPLTSLRLLPLPTQAQVPKKKRDEAAAGEEEERTVSVIASLLQHCSKQVWG